MHAHVHVNIVWFYVLIIVWKTSAFYRKWFTAVTWCQGKEIKRILWFDLVKPFPGSLLNLTWNGKQDLKNRIAFWRIEQPPCITYMYNLQTVCPELIPNHLQMLQKINCKLNGSLGRVSLNFLGAHWWNADWTCTEHPEIFLLTRINSNQRGLVITYPAECEM